MSDMTEETKPTGVVIETSDESEIVSYKGFDLNFRCRSFQYEVGGSYTHDGSVIACESGFHACEYPLDVFQYYPPSSSRYAEVCQSGAVDRHDDDTKIASLRLAVTVELSLSDLIGRAIKWVFDRSVPEDSASATGGWGAASATGVRGAASATGQQGRAMGALGCALFLVYREDSGEITHAWAGIVGRDGIEPNVWYSLSANGTPVEVRL